ncbi:hypothetical protein SDC9_13793 [bioreactor metagenome]|uniref:Uncharacterized protein n=1 Tax=bioreactor metagenome TaxID=1076179 RepID=A0A644TME4_9ZZZZ|nr:hypothetical protein [Negativicutes bacterium]
MNLDTNKLSKQECRDYRDHDQASAEQQELGKVDEITIVIRGGKIIKFEQRFV